MAPRQSTTPDAGRLVPPEPLRTFADYLDAGGGEALATAFEIGP